MAIDQQQIRFEPFKRLSPSHLAYCARPSSKYSITPVLSTVSTGATWCALDTAARIGFSDCGPNPVAPGPLPPSPASPKRSGAQDLCTAHPDFNTSGKYISSNSNSKSISWFVTLPHTSVARSIAKCNGHEPVHEDSSKDHVSPTRVIGW